MRVHLFDAACLARPVRLKCALLALAAVVPLWMAMAQPAVAQPRDMARVHSPSARDIGGYNPVYDTPAGQAARAAESMPAAGMEDSGANAARLGARYMEMEETIRALRGEIERMRHQLDRQKQEHEAAAANMEFRLERLEAGAPGTVRAPGAAMDSVPPASVGQPPAPQPGTQATTSSGVPLTALPDNVPANVGGIPSAAAPAAGNPASADTLQPLAQTRATGRLTQDVKLSGNPKDDYNFAFALLNQSRYEEAEANFRAFIAQYPQHTLTSNAYYWLGETFYARGGYVDAADSFRKGYEHAPKGNKAPDNLLKLALSLSAMNHTQDACTILGELDKQYGTSAPTLAQKAKQEQYRLSCARTAG